MKTIRASGADVVGLEEGEGSTAAPCPCARLARERAAAGDLALPPDRPAGSQRPLRLHRARARAGGGDRQLPPSVRSLRSVPGAGRRLGGGAGRARALHAAARDPAADHRSAGAGGGRRPGVRPGRLQLALAPRLDAGGRRRPRRGAVRLRLAREPRVRRRGLPRLLPRGASRPGGGTRVHLDARRGGVRSERGPRPHRLGAGLRPCAHARERDRRRAGRSRCGHRPQPVSDRPPRRRLHLRRPSGQGARLRRPGDSSAPDRAEPHRGLPRRGAGRARPGRPGRSGRRAADAGRGRDADVRDRRARARRVRSGAARPPRPRALPRSVLAVSPRRAGQGLHLEARLRAGRADRRPLVECAGHALGLAGHLPGEAGEHDPLRHTRVPRRLLRQRRLPALRVHTDGDPGEDDVFRRLADRATAPGRSGPACTRSGSCWTTATAPRAKSKRFRIIRPG